MVNSTRAVIFLCVSSHIIQAVVRRKRSKRGRRRINRRETRAKAKGLQCINLQCMNLQCINLQMAKQIRRSGMHGGKGGSGLSSSSHGGKGRSGRRNNGGKGTHEGSEKMPVGRSRGQLLISLRTSRYQKLTVCGRKETIACAQTMIFLPFQVPPSQKIISGRKLSGAPHTSIFRLSGCAHTSMKRRKVELLRFIDYYFDY